MAVQLTYAYHIIHHCVSMAVNYRSLLAPRSFIAKNNLSRPVNLETLESTVKVYPLLFNCIV